MVSDTPDSNEHQSDRKPRMYRRGFLAAAGMGTAIVAGCVGAEGDDLFGDAGTNGDSPTGRFRLLVSDRPSAIGDFESLNVSFEKARVFRAGPNDADDNDDEVDAEADDDNGENGTDDNGDPADQHQADGPQGYVDIDLDGATADLTNLIGVRATEVADVPLEEGRYSSIQLYVQDVQGLASDEYDPDAHPSGNGSDQLPDHARNDQDDDPDDEADVADEDDDAPQELSVHVPSERLRIVRPFEIVEGEEVAFVFDINVVRRGDGQYNLLPVIGESGIAGKDVEVEEVDDTNGGPEEESPSDDDEEEENGDDDDVADE